MLYTRPDYYEEFECIADKCEDTCCAGWQIVIDRETLKKYTKIKGDFRKRMFRSVNWFTGTFKQDREKRCAFLNDRNLCDLYLSQMPGLPVHLLEFTQTHVHRVGDAIQPSHPLSSSSPAPNPSQHQSLFQ